MKYLLRNLTRRPVSIPCNSGSYRHLPPKQQLAFEAVEIEANPMVMKLIERGVLAKVPDVLAQRPAAEIGDLDAPAAPLPTVKAERAPKPPAPGGPARKRSGPAD